MRNFFIKAWIVIKVIVRTIRDYIKYEIWVYRWKRIFRRGDCLYIHVHYKKVHCRISSSGADISKLKTKKEILKYVEKNIYEPMLDKIRGDK